MASLRGVITSRFNAWLERRIPRSKTVTLNQRRIFIFPSKAGFGFLLTLFLLLLAAINYQNNLIFALTFLLASMFVVTILHTYANLSGLTIQVLRTQPGFVGDAIEFVISMSRNNSREYDDVVMRWPESDPVSLSLKQQSEITASLFLPGVRRGVLRPQRLLVETLYPLGLLRAWTWIALDTEALVYPVPLACDWHAGDSKPGDDGEALPLAGSDDFYGMRDYQKGDSLKQINWKSYAKGLPLQTKQFSVCAEQGTWLCWQDFTGDTEQRLSGLCYWILALEKQRQDYGLRLPNGELFPGRGELHRAEALALLARFEEAKP